MISIYQKPANLLVTGLLLLGLAHPVLAQTPTFQSVATYSSGPASTSGFGSNPNGLAVADVNHDGRLDLLTANYNTRVAAVLLGRGDGTFQNAVTYSTGTTSAPRRLAVADVNGDGNLDLLTANQSTNSAGVLLGNGDGTFRAVTNYALGTGTPYDIAVADVNGDGKPDLLTANQVGASASVLLGNGNGTFQTAVVYSTGAGSRPYSITAADVNGDGKLDLFTANFDSNTVSVLLGNGNGTFQTVTTYAVGTGNSPAGIAVADVNGDGSPDLLTSNFNTGTAGVLLGNGNGTFQTAAIYSTGAGSRPFDIAVADINGDGRLDLSTASGNGTAGVLLGNGNGTFQSATATNYSTGLNSGSSDIAVADVNGDSKPDLLTANSNSNTLGVLLNTTVASTPTLTTISPASGPVGTRVTLTGTNLAGALQVSFNGTLVSTFVNNTATQLVVDVPVGATSGSVTVTTPAGTSNGVTFTVVAPLAITAVVPAAGTRSVPGSTPVQVSFNQVLSSSSAAALKVYSAQRGGLRTTAAAPAVVSGATLTFAPPAARPFLPGETVFSTVTTTASSASGNALTQPRVFQFTAATGGSGIGNFGGGSEVNIAATGGSPSGLALGDVDNDGDVDLVTANDNYNGTASVRLNNGSGTFTGTQNVSIGNFPVQVVLADVDGDGDLDLLATNGDVFGAGAVNVRFNNGAGVFSGTQTVSVGNGPSTFVVGDVDGDGDLDFVTANEYSNSVSVRLNNGAGVFSGGSESAVAASPYGVAIGDIDGDGDLDLVTTGFASTSAQVLRNNGSGSFSSFGSVVVGIYGYSLQLGDADGDGDLDLFAANNNIGGPGTVSVRLNNGSGTFSGTQNVSVGTGVRYIALGDVDADGDLDFVTANNGSSSVGGNTTSVRLNNGSGTFAAPATNPEPTVGMRPWVVALADIDADGDVDLLTGNDINTVSVRLNGTGLAAAPTITSFTPTSGPVGTVITLNGTGLTGTTAVTFGGGAVVTTGFAVNAAGTQITGLVVPAGAQTGVISVTTPGGTATSTGSFTVIPPNPVPTLTALTPPAAPAGSPAFTLTVTGSGFVAGSVVRFNGVVLTTTFGSATQLTAAVPALALTAAGSYPVDVTNPAPGGGTSGSLNFVVTVPVPVLTSLSPNAGLVGTSVTITGTALNGATSVSFNGATTTSFSNNTATSLTVTVPSGATSGPVTVTTPGGTSNGLAFTVTCPPSSVAYSASSYCQSGTNPTPTAAPTGGTFSSATGLSLNATTGAINLAASTPGTYTVTYTVSGSCPSSATASVTVSGAPVATFAYANPAYCTSGINPAPVLAPGASAGAFSSTAGLVVNASTGVINLAASAPGTYIVTNTVAAAGGCAAATASTSITINAVSSAAFAYAGSPFCQNGPNPTPTVTGTSGGAFSAPAGLTIDPATGTLNLAASTAGTYTITYSVGGACPSSSTQNVTITALPTAGFGYASTANTCTANPGPVAPVMAAGATTGTFTSTAGLTIDAATGAITPSASAPGTYTVTNSVPASGGCAAVSATASVTINQTPTATLSLGGPATFCEGGSVVLTASAGTGNTYQFFRGSASLGAASAVNTFTATAGGAYTVVVTSAGGCSATSAATTVTVNPQTTATFSFSSNAFCQSGPNPTPTITGTSGGTFSAPTGLSIDPSTGTVNLTASISGTYLVTYSVGGACPSTATQRITISTPAVATFSYANAAYCVGGANPTPALAAGATAGTFSSTTGLSLNAATGAIGLAASVTGTYTVTNTIAASSGCAAVTATATITVAPATTATFSYGGTSFCVSGTNPTPVITGTAGGTFSSTTGLSLNATTGTLNLGASAPGTYTVTYTVAGPCGSTGTATLTITAPPTAAFGYPAGTAYCAGSAGTIAPTLGAGATAGMFSSTTGLAIDASTGVITLNSSTPGTYTVTNLVAAGNGCAAVTATASVTITPAASAAFSYGTMAYCLSGPNPTPVITGTAGGTFSSTTGLSLNATTGVINSSTSTAGTYTVTYAVSGACGSSSTQRITLTAPASASFSYPAAAVCTSASSPLAATLASGATAGTFTSTAGLSLNASTGAITASASTPGTYTVTNTVAASGSCAGTSATAQVVINAATTATFSYAGSSFCQSGTNPTATIAGTTGGAFSSTTGLSVDAATGTIALAASTPGTYTVTYSVSGPCPSTSTQRVTITAPAAATFTYPGTTYCVSGATNPAPTLSAGATAGTFSSTTGLTIDAATGAITLSSSTPGTYTVTNTVAASGGCAAVAATRTVTITAAPTATFSYASAVNCEGAGSVSATLATGAMAGTFSSTAGLTINATTGAVDLATSTPGTYTVTNTVAPAGGCAAAAATAAFIVTARPARPVLTATYNGTTTTLTSSASTGNQFFLNGVAIPGATGPTYVINGAPGQLGSYTVVATSAQGCASLPSAVLVVTSSVKPLAGSTLRLYPNPTPDGRFNVELAGYYRPVELQVYNALGQIVYSATLKGSAGTTVQSIDLTHLASGVYVLRARTEGSLDTRRIVKQ